MDRYDDLMTDDKKQLVADVLTTALESGIPWIRGRVASIALHSPLDTYQQFAETDIKLHIRIDNMVDDDTEYIRLTREKFMDAIADYCLENNLCLQHFAEEQDADSADVIMQYALFGEYIYG